MPAPRPHHRYRHAIMARDNGCPQNGQLELRAVRLGPLAEGPVGRGARLGAVQLQDIGVLRDSDGGLNTAASSTSPSRSPRNRSTSYSRSSTSSDVVLEVVLVEGRLPMCSHSTSTFSEHRGPEPR